MIVISDIHGGYEALEIVLDTYHKKGEKILILGDILYHGPRNDLSNDYNVKRVIEILDRYKEDIIAVCGNCDASVDKMVLPFTLHPDYTFEAYGHKIYMNHGDLPFNTDASIILTGHTHVHKLEGDSVIFCNPGSITLPKLNQPKSFAIIDSLGISILNVEGEVLAKKEFNNQKVILFDLDGTILNTLPSIYKSIKEALKRYGCKAPSKAKVAAFLGNGIKKTIRRVLNDINRIDLYDEIVLEFAKQYHIYRISYVKQYPKMAKVLTILKQQYRLGVVTNKSHEDATAIINHFFPDIFEYILGANSNLKLKPNAEYLSGALEHFKVASSDICYIGDAIVDYDFALATGMEVILTLYGYGDKEAIKRTKTRGVIKKPSDLLNILK